MTRAPEGGARGRQLSCVRAQPDLTGQPALMRRQVRLVLENHSWSLLDRFGVIAMLIVLLIWTGLFAYVLNDSPGSFGWGFLYGTGRLFARRDPHLATAV